MQHKILIIDDDAELAQMLQVRLERKKYRAFMAASGTEGLQKAYQTNPDLIILDIMMPKMNGWEVCRRLRELSDVPIIMLTARAMEGDVVKGLEGGADDYLTKPFSLPELEARMQALLRRHVKADNQHNATPPFYTNGRLTIDLERRLVKVRDEVVKLSVTEFKLLSILVHHEGRVLPHRYLLNEVWGPEYLDREDYVKLYIRYLRRKIEEDPSDPVYIQTVWGEGYCFSTPAGF